MTAQKLIDETTQYAREVVSGKIVAGELVIKACQRHLDDLDWGVDRGLTWDLEAAQDAIEFFPAMLTITEGAKEGEPFTLLPWHVFVVGSIFGWKNKEGFFRFNFAWLETGKGQAKALDVDTPIPTPSGFVRMGDLVDGDLVYGADGNPTEVIRAHPVIHGAPCSVVKFDDGSEIVASDDHLWKTEQQKSGSTTKGVSTKGVPLSERGAWRNAVRTTDEIRDTLRYKNGKYHSANHRIEICAPVSGTEKELVIPPYLLGVWLGDGDSDGPRITCGDQDLSSLLEQFDSRGITYREPKETNTAWRIIANIGGAACRDGFGARLKRSGLIKNKHIPEQYFTASIDQRRELLRGLMDSDGTVTNGQCSFSNTNENLANNVLALCLSLGLKATKCEKAAKINGRYIGQVYQINFYANLGEDVFTLSRKVERVAAKHQRQRLSATRKIIDVVSVPSRPVRCITVAAEDSLFLCGKEHIPTHNSPLMASIGIYLSAFYGKKRAEVYCIGETKDTAKVMFRDAVAMLRAPIPDGDGVTLEDEGFVIRGTGDLAYKVEHPASSSFMLPIANGDAVSGPKPILVAADEIHELKSNSGIEMWKAAIAKKHGDSIMMLGTNTPSVDQVVGTDYSELAQKVMRGDFSDDSIFAYIARVDKTDDPMNDEDCWIKALPALGITYPAENVRKLVATAKEQISTALTTKRLYFGIPVGSAGFWCSELAWDECQGVVDEDEMKGRKLHLSLDLSQKNDLTAVSGCWEGETLDVKSWYWTREFEIADRSTADHISYREIAELGQITITPGRVIDYSFVADQIIGLCSRHDVVQMVVDAAKLEDLLREFTRAGFDYWVYSGPDEPEGFGLKIVKHRQGLHVAFKDVKGREQNKDNPQTSAVDYLCMPTSISQLEDKMLSNTVRIDTNKITTICASNVVTRTDGMANKMFGKDISRGRIDGMVTIAMAVGSAASSMQGREDASYMDNSEMVFL